MKTERIIIRKKLNEIPEVAANYSRESEIDIEKLPKNYKKKLDAAKELVMKELEISIVYKCENIINISETEVTLESGIKYTGYMPPRILKDSEQVITYVIALNGYDQLIENVKGVSNQFFVDSWGSAYVGNAQKWLGKALLEELKEEGMSRTHIWSPGQHQFEIENQKAIFELLKPEDIGCTLSKSLMMVPVKASSGIMGIVEEGKAGLLIPCDFCRFGGNCPGSRRGCAEL